MAKGILVKNGYGGGEELNFKVIAYESEDSLPETAAENTIAVITNTPISGYQISAGLPENPEEGFVWILSGGMSEAPIAVTKKNSVFIYPSAAKQYVGGAWVKRTAKSYQGGNWVDWVAYLYTPGDVRADLTGGYVSFASSNSTGETFLDDDGMHITCKRTGGSWYANRGFNTVNKVDLSEYKTLFIAGQMDAVTGDSGVNFNVTDAQGADAAKVSGIEFYESGTFVKGLDVSNLSGSYYLWINVFIYTESGATSQRSASINKIWAE